MANGQGYIGLTPHPVIVGLNKGLNVGVEGATVPDLKAATQAALDAAGRAALIAAPPAAGAQAAGADPPVTQQFSDAQRAEVVMFAGYLGPWATSPEDKRPWWFLYQDSCATSWLLVPQDAIVLHQRAPDCKAAFQLRDVIWVKADAPVRQGDEAESRQARFLIGTFTRAGDLHASLSDGGSLSPASGILCAPTPQCCGRHSK